MPSGHELKRLAHRAAEEIKSLAVIGKDAAADAAAGIIEKVAADAQR